MRRLNRVLECWSVFGRLVVVSLSCAVLVPALLLANEPPAANDQTVVVAQDFRVRFALDISDDGGPGPYSCDVGAPSHGTLVHHRRVEYNYVPDAGYVGEDFVVWSCHDGEFDSPLATVTILVNDQPVATPQDVAATEDQASVFGLDVIDEVTPGPAVTIIDTAPTSGSLVEGEPGQMTYTPAAGFIGSDRFKYRYCDGAMCSTRTQVSILVNDEPVAQAGQLALNNDEFGAVTLEVADEITPGEGEFLIDLQPSNGTLSEHAPGEYQYTPHAESFGPDAFEFHYCDGWACSNTAVFDLDVNAVPIARDQSEEMFRNTSLDLLLDWDDPDGAPGPYEVTLLTEPDHGTLNENGEVGNYTYLPDLDYAGLDSFAWSISDGLGYSNGASVSINVDLLPEIFLSAEHLNYRLSEDEQPAEISRIVRIANTGGGVLDWSVRNIDGSTLVEFDPPSGSLGRGESQDVVVSGILTGQFPVVLSEVIEFFASGAINSPQVLTATVRVAKAGGMRLGLNHGIGEFETEDGSGYIRDLSVDSLRLGVDWNTAEPEQTAFDWTSLRSVLGYAVSGDLRVLLTVSSGCPEWVVGTKSERGGCVPDDMQEFRDFVSALVGELVAYAAERPNGLPVEWVQFGNEWDKVESSFYPGSEEQFVEQLNIVHDEFKAFFPDLPVVVGGMTRQAMYWYAVCGGQIVPPGPTEEQIARYCADNWDGSPQKVRIDHVFQNGSYDVADLHLYFDPENWGAFIEALRSELLPADKQDIPILVSEFGGPNAKEESRDDDYHRDRVEEYLDALIPTGVEAAFYYRLIEEPEQGPGGEGRWLAESGLISKDTLLPKPAYDLYKDYSENER